MPAFIPDAAQVLDDLRTFVCSEFDGQRRKFAEQMALPRVERVEKGTCFEGLRFAGLDEKGRAKFHHAGNDSRLREGDLVLLGRENNTDPTQAWIYREEQGMLWLSEERGFPPALFRESDGWFIDEAFLDLESFYLAALDRLPASGIGQERILPLLMGTAEPGLDEDEYNAAQQEMADQPVKWEDAQREAIAGCLAADHCYLVQGPPGTGKTRVLAQVVRQLVARGERVLVTAFTHRAIDHALAASAREIGDRQRVARFGAATHRRDENYDSFECYADSPLRTLTEGGWVAGATPFALRKRLTDVEFDTIVVDEAGQMTTPLAIMAMLTGRKYLLFGDQQQLGPVVVSRPRRDAEFIGIFHALKDQTNHGTLLDVTYRLNDVLTHWPAENFYHGELTPAPAAAMRRLVCAIPDISPVWLKEVIHPGSPLVWLRFPEDRSRTVSEGEAGMAAEILRALHASGVAPEEIAVVTPYRRQARRLRRRLETLMPELAQDWRTCLIDTVERMQGQEREVILLSLCASDPYFIRQQAEFLYDPRRLNVAATRARTKLIILASDSLLHTPLHDTDLTEDQALFQSLQRCAVKVQPGVFVQPIF